MGGGAGHFAQKMYEQKYPGQTITLFDQPRTAKDMITSPNIRRILGDFFKTVPEGFDLYFWKRVAHDFSDDEVVKLLKLNRNVAPDATVVICEMVLDRGLTGSPYIMEWSIHMRMVTGGHEREAKTWAEIAEKAGYKISQIIPTNSPMSLIVLK